MKSRPFRVIRTGVEAMPAGDVARHYHREGYANVVLSGGFVESSFAGRSTAVPGDVLLHGAFDAHADVGVSRHGPRILRLPWAARDVEGHFRVDDPDRLARIAEDDPFAATAALAAALVPVARDASHWSARLATVLATSRALRIERWADEERMSPEAVSRGFRRAFGVSPKLFRLEARTRAAWRAIVDSDHDLTSIAHDVGFADLAHMTRSIGAMTRQSPSAWRGGRRDQLRSSRLARSTA